MTRAGFVAKYSSSQMGRVDERDAVKYFNSATRVNVTEGMDLRSDDLDAIAQISTPEVLVVRRIEYAHRRPMCDEHVRTLGYQIPFAGKRRAHVVS